MYNHEQTHVAHTSEHVHTCAFTAHTRGLLCQVSYLGCLQNAQILHGVQVAFAAYSSNPASKTMKSKSSFK